MKRALTVGGGALAAGGLAFLLWRVRESIGQFDLERHGRSTWIAIAALVVPWAAANALLACAWNELLRALGGALPRREAFRIYAFSSLGRYVPGNVFHLASRQALAMASGVAGGVAARSAVAELALISFAGALFALPLVPLLHPAAGAFVSMVAFLAAVVAAAFVIARRAGPSVARAFVAHLVFLGVSGALFVAVLASLQGWPPGSPSLAPVAAAYVVAWLVGLVTPGAPAGLGVREAVLLFLLGGAFGEAALLLAILAARLCNVAGDLLFVAACAAWRAPAAEAA